MVVKKISLSDAIVNLLKLPKKYNIYYPIKTVEDFAFYLSQKIVIPVFFLYIVQHVRGKKFSKITGYKYLQCKEEKKKVSIEIFFFRRMAYGIKQHCWYSFMGEVVEKDGKYFMYNPRHMSKTIEQPLVNPVYFVNLRKNNKQAKIVAESFQNPEIGKNLLNEWLPKRLMNHLGWLSFLKSIEWLHKPILEGNDIEAIVNINNKLQKATHRVLLDEVVYCYSKHFFFRREETCLPQFPGSHTKEYLSHWKLTPSQSTSLQEIQKDMLESKRMFRLLYGEVGSGKTLLAFASSLIAIDSGYQAVIIVPTQILAQQMYEKFLKETNNNLECYLVTSKTSTRKLITCPMIIGTHAACNLKFEKVGIIIFDEQHKFGVRQRQNIIQKQISSHIMFMSATPIPRTLFMIQHGFMDVSYLSINRKNILSYLFPVEKIDKVLPRVIHWLNKGEKIFWVCSAINTFADRVGCVERYNLLKSNLENQSVFILHGKQEEEERDKNISDFTKAKNAIIVCTSIIEVGINIPDSTIIVIENAERFGVAQLHQLRGRVGRAGQEGKCLFLFKDNEEAKNRLQFIIENNDSKSLSDFDMKSRGIGDIHGYEQRGKKKWVIARDIPDWIVTLAAKIYKQNLSENQPDFITQFFAGEEESILMS